MKKILFCVPRADYRPKSQQPPFGILSMSAVLKQAGHTVELFDDSIRKSADAELRDYFLKSAPDIIGISVNVENRFSAKKMGDTAKAVLPDVPLVFGGPFATLCYESILKDWQCVDIIALGEAEYSMLEIVEAADKNDFSRIEGIALRKEGKNIVNGHKRFIEDLEQLPDPDFELVDINDYPRYFSELRLDKTGVVSSEEIKGPTASLVFGRGCPFRCIFCNTSALSNNKHRIIAPERAVSFIEWYYSKGVKNFTFWDDDLTINKKWFFRFCELLAEKDIKIIYKCVTSARFIDEEIADKLYESGCRLITMGIEHGSDGILEKMNKRLTQRQIENTIGLLSARGVFVHGNFMLNTPGETINDIRESLVFFARMEKKFSYQAALPYPMKLYPGTPLEDMLIENKLMQSVNWTQPYYEKRNLFLRATPFIPLYENIKSEKLLSESIASMVELRQEAFFHRMIFTNLNNIFKLREFSLYERFMYVLYIARGMFTVRKGNMFAGICRNIIFAFKAVFSQAVNKTVKRVKLKIFKDKTPLRREGAENMYIVYISYSKLDMNTANSVQTHSTVRELYKISKNLEIFVPYIPVSLRKQDKDLPVRFIRYPSVKKAFALLGLSSFFPSYFSFFDQLGFGITVAAILFFRKLKGKMDNALIYVRDIPFASLYNIAFKRIVRSPLVVEFPSLEVNLPYVRGVKALKGIFSFIDRTAIEFSEGVVPQSEFLRKYMIDNFKRRLSEIKAVTNGFDSRIFYPVEKVLCRKMLDLDEKKFIVLYAGLTNNYRNVDELVNIAGKFKTSDVSFMFVGCRPGEMERLCGIRDDAGISADKFVCVEPVSLDKVALYINAADVCIIQDIATDDSPTLKLFEYIACAKPVVCIDKPVIRDILGEDYSLYANDTREFVERIELLRTDNSLYEKLSRDNLAKSDAYSYKNRASHIYDFCRIIKNGFYSKKKKDKVKDETLDQERGSSVEDPVIFSHAHTHEKIKSL